MPVPKRKVSRSRASKRYSSRRIKAQTFAECPNCKAFLLPHQACEKCGFYKGKKVLETKSDRTIKRTETKKAKEGKSDEKK